MNPNATIRTNAAGLAAARDRNRSMTSPADQHPQHTQDDVAWLASVIAKAAEDPWSTGGMASDVPPIIARAVFAALRARGWRRGDEAHGSDR